jgi:hypothetical protein
MRRDDAHRGQRYADGAAYRDDRRAAIHAIAEPDAHCDVGADDRRPLAEPNARGDAHDRRVTRSSDDRTEPKPRADCRHAARRDARARRMR